MLTALTCIAAVLLDRTLGAPRRGRPLSRFLRLAGHAEVLLNKPGLALAGGTAAFLLLVLPFVVLVDVAAKPPLVGTAVAVLVLFLGLGAAGLTAHGEALGELLRAGDLGAARERLRWLAGGTVNGAGPGELSFRAVAELLRQGSDEVFAVLFWFLLAGPGGVAAWRLTQALAREWAGLREFGAGARLAERLLGFAPALLTALTYLLLGDRAAGWRAWRFGVPLAAGQTSVLPAVVGAGALGVHGSGVPADPPRAAQLVRLGLWAWLAGVVLAELLL